MSLLIFAEMPEAYWWVISILGLAWAAGLAFVLWIREGNR